MKIVSKKDAKELGLKTYFTGSPCKRGHSSPRRTDNGDCVYCQRERSARHRTENPEAVKTYNETYQGAYRAKNLELLRAKSRAYHKLRDKNKERERLINYRLDNPERYAENQKRYRQKWPEKINAKTRKYQAEKMQRTPSWLTEDDIWMMQEIYDLAVLRTKLTRIPWEADHIIPLRGKNVSGFHSPLNLQVITQEHNRRKHNTWDPDHGQ